MFFWELKIYTKNKFRTRHMIVNLKKNSKLIIIYSEMLVNEHKANTNVQMY